MGRNALGAKMFMFSSATCVYKIKYACILIINLINGNFSACNLHEKSGKLIIHEITLNKLIYHL